MKRIVKLLGRLIYLCMTLTLLVACQSQDYKDNKENPGNQDTQDNKDNSGNQDTQDNQWIGTCFHYT